MDQSFHQIKSDAQDWINVRFVQQVKIRIGEAKNLQPKNGTSSSLRDCYCVISLDREEIFRTHNSIDKTSDPFFGEEFNFDIPRMFRYLSIFVYERERSVQNCRNRALGKVLLRRDQLKNFDYEESWFPLIPENDPPEVQGVIHLQIEPHYIMNINSLRIIVTILECQDIAHHSCDSYCLLDLRVFDDVFQKKSKIKRKTNNPQFNEAFVFEIPLDKYSNITCNSQLLLDDLLNKSNLRISIHEPCSKTNHLGGIRIVLNRLKVNSTHNAWYYLQPQISSTSLSSTSSCSTNLSTSNHHNHHQNCDHNLGSLRLRINYISDFVFPSPFYDSLRNLLLSSTETKPITCSVAYLLGEFVLNKADAAQPLVKIFLHFHQIVAFIKYLAQDEMAKVSDVNTIFRGNSLVSKCIDELMKLVGIRYLHDTLGDCIELVIRENKLCEIDASKIDDCDCLKMNMQHLKNYAHLFFTAIIDSMNKCPQVMCDVFAVLRELAIKFFPDNKHVCYYVISGFVFLRFFAPAILNPRLFELTDKKINPRVNRTFTLISKTIQSIGNLVVSKKNTPLIKENYMTQFYKEFITDYHVSKTKEFLESISSCCRLSSKDHHEPVILKESVMFKKSNGYKRIGFGTCYKKRYFCITTQHFYYAKAKNKSPLFKFPISEITVKKLADNYPMKNMFQVIHNKCILNIQAINCVQEREWLDTLNGLIELNKSSQINNDNNDINDNKSSLTTTNNNNNDKSNQRQQQQTSLDWSLRLDVDRELARINSLFMANMDTIQNILEATNAQMNDDTNLQCFHGDYQSNRMVRFYKGNGHNYPPSQFIIEDCDTLILILNQLKECVCHLDKMRKQYVQSIIGSQLAPIENIF